MAFLDNIFTIFYQKKETVYHKQSLSYFISSGTFQGTDPVPIKGVRYFL
jgi:hypothetical protein